MVLLSLLLLKKKQLKNNFRYKKKKRVPIEATEKVALIK